MTESRTFAPTVAKGPRPRLTEKRPTVAAANARQEVRPRG